jgi:hypothetical protein
MAIWSSALGYPVQWRGPTPNRVAGGMYEWRGVVLHIAEGSYEGTISWQLNPAASVSSHFIVAKDGRIAQMVDTLDRAWTQVDGNGRWLSIEHEGFHGEPLTDAQIEADAHLYAEAALVYGVPLQTTDDPAGGYGLGYHAMGGAAWGGHYDCPGDPIIAQRQRILDRCAQLLHPAPPEEDDMPAFQTGQLKPGFFEDVLSDDGTTVLAPKRSFVTELAVPPCNGGALPWGDGYLSFAADFTGTGRVSLDVSVHDGIGWHVTPLDFDANSARKGFKLPNGAGKVSIMRKRQSPTDTSDTVPVAWLLEYGRR